MQKKNAPPVAAEPEGKREFLDALANGLQLMEAFNEEMRSVTIQSAAELLGVTRPASRRILLTLVELGYMQQNDRQFSLAPLHRTGIPLFPLPGAGRCRAPPPAQALARAGRGRGPGDPVRCRRAVRRAGGGRPPDQARPACGRPPARLRALARTGAARPAPAGPAGRASAAGNNAPARAAHRHGTPGARPGTRAHPRARLELRELRAGQRPVRRGDRTARLGGQSTIGLNVTSIGEPWSVREIEERIVPALQECAQAMRPITDSLA